MSSRLIPKFFFYHHFFMAFCTVMLCMQTYWYVQANSINVLLLVFLFTATLFSYNIHFYLASKKTSESDQLSWFKKYESFTVLLNAISLLTTLLLFLKLKTINIYIVITVLLNAAYTAPLLFKSAIKLPLIFTFVKSYFIGFTWAVATVILPLAFLQIQPGITELCIFIHRFLLVSLATLIFDYRDKQRDKMMGVYTPANTMTEVHYHIFFLFHVLIFSTSSLWLVLMLPLSFQWLQLIPCVYMWWLYLQSKKSKDDLFYLSYVDGSLFLSAILSIFLLI